MKARLQTRQQTARGRLECDHGASSREATFRWKTKWSGDAAILQRREILGDDRLSQNETGSTRDRQREHLLEIQQEMKGFNEAECVGSNQHGTIFEKITRLYKEYKLAGGTLADDWAREANSNLHSTLPSHYSHGDCDGLGFTSSREKKLGINLTTSHISHKPNRCQHRIGN